MFCLTNVSQTYYLLFILRENICFYSLFDMKFLATCSLGNLIEWDEIRKNPTCKWKFFLNEIKVSYSSRFDFIAQMIILLLINMILFLKLSQTNIFHNYTTSYGKFILVQETNTFIGELFFVRNVFFRRK